MREKPNSISSVDGEQRGNTLMASDRSGGNIGTGEPRLGAELRITAIPVRFACSHLFAGSPDLLCRQSRTGEV